MPETTNQIPTGTPKDYRKVLKRAKEQDFRFGKSWSEHPMVYPPDKKFRPIPIPTTPGNPKLLIAFIAQLRRAGLK